MAVRERLIPWAGQPAGAVRAHPKWGEQLRFLSVGGQLLNLGAYPAGQSAQDSQQGAPATFGAGFETTGANHQMTGGGPGVLTSSVREVFVAQFRIEALPAGTAYLFGTCSNFTSNPSLHALYINASGQIGIAHRASGAALVAISASRTHAAGGVVTAVGVSTATNSRRIYLATGESASSSSSSAATNPANYFAGGHAYSGNYPLLTIGLLAHIDGAPDDEAEFVRRLLANPYGELVEPQRIWVPVSSGAGATTISGGVGNAAAAGLGAAISLPLIVGSGIGAASAAGHAAGISLPTPIAVGVGSAAAAGHQAAISAGQSIAAGVGAASAAGHAATITLPVSIAAGVGQAAAAGHNASVALGTTIACGTGAATAAGHAASIALTTAVTCGAGDAAAAGHAATITAGGTSISAGIGAAAAAGQAASIALTTSIACGVGAAQATGAAAVIQAGDIVIQAGVGAAAAAGHQAAIAITTRIASGVGAASAAGSAAQIALPTSIGAGVGAATADGAAAAMALTTRISGGVANATAAGLDCGITVATSTVIPCGVGAAVAQGHSLAGGFTAGNRDVWLVARRARVVFVTHQ